MLVMSGLSGNEMYCLDLKGFAPGDLVLGNSVYSLGFLGSIGAGDSQHHWRRSVAGNSGHSRWPTAGLRADAT